MVIAGAMSPIGKMPVNHGKEAGEKPTLSYWETTRQSFNESEKPWE